MGDRHPVEWVIGLPWNTQLADSGMSRQKNRYRIIQTYSRH